MAKKSKKAARRRSRPSPAEMHPTPMPEPATPTREVTLDGAMHDLAILKAALSSLL